ncbi:MAG: DUF3990 domain-containing protein [Eubacterium sp.]|nr:DUF3990 domain-containing protein [Eubacterium sp.]
MLVYHTGYQIIKEPDVHYGRKNADFGQGFYMTGNMEFSERWARERKGYDTCLNTYELDLTGLSIHRFSRDEAWFDYIYDNRRGKPDALPEADVIIGPIANDTIYDTMGIFTSGFLSKDQVMEMLLAGPAYEQIVLKTEAAAGKLSWQSVKILTPEDILKYRDVVKREEAEYQREIGRILGG